MTEHDLSTPMALTAEEFTAKLKEAGLSQAGFAARTGHERQTVNRWAREKRGVPPWVDSWLDLYMDKQALIAENRACRILQDQGE